MSMISVKNVSFHYPNHSEMIFEKVNFQMDSDWKLGFCGRNGRGKTTFLKMLMKEYEYCGEILHTVHFNYFPFNVENPMRTTYEIVLEILQKDERWKIEKELNKLQVMNEVLDRNFSSLSQGEQTKVLIALLFLKENQFLLIDEPTNHLDIHGRKSLAAYLKSKKGFIVISHDRMFLDTCIDHILSINKASIEIQKGNFSTWFQNKQACDQFEIKKNEKLMKNIVQMNEGMLKASRWAHLLEQEKFQGKLSSGLRPDRGAIGHKAAKMMKRKKNIERRKMNAIEEKSKLLKNIETEEKLDMIVKENLSTILLEVRDLSICYENVTVCKNISFTISNKERIAICGKNGSGKSSLLKAILGEKLNFSGEIFHSDSLVISFVSQSTNHLFGSLLAYCESNFIEEDALKSLLMKLDFSPVQFELNLENLSEGQKKKLLIASSLLKKAHLYIFDEPLNYIDVLSRIQLEELIIQFEPTMLFVEHDLTFVEKIATKVIEL